MYDFEYDRSKRICVMNNTYSMKGEPMEATWKKAYVNGLLIALNVPFFRILRLRVCLWRTRIHGYKGAMHAPAVLSDGEYYLLLTANVHVLPGIP